MWASFGYIFHFTSNCDGDCVIEILSSYVVDIVLNINNLIHMVATITDLLWLDVKWKMHLDDAHII
jgi:hypothetical protein